MTSAGVLPAAKRSEHAFFGGMALAILGTALAGFAPTYFLRPLLPVPVLQLPALTSLVHLHAFLFTGWVMVFYVQTRLVGWTRIDLHRRLGQAAAAMAAAMIVVGTLTALHGALRGISPFGMDPRRFLIVPLVAIALFAVFIGAGIRARRDPQTHKRYMLLATVALLPPAIARWVLLLGLGPPVVLAVATLFLVPLVIWDLRTRGSLHPVTMWGGLLIAISGPLRLVISRTDGWLEISNWLVRLVS